MATLFKKKQNLNLEMKIYLAQLLQEILTDQEYFLDLKEDIKKKLKEFRKGKIKTVPFEKIKNKYLNE
jgi:glycopeptide antibiotics resistance protein